MKHIGFGLSFLLLTMSSSAEALAAVAIPLTVNLSEIVTVTGTPQISVDVGGIARTATYTSGTGTNALTFTLSPQAGDVDLDGISISSPINLNGGTIKDTKGNDATLTFTPPNTANVKVNYPSLGMDFVYDADGRYTLNGTVYNDLTSFLSFAGGTFSRSSIGTYFDSTGMLQTAASGIPRFDYDPVTHAARGLLLEETRTNSLSNANMVGAVAGIVGSGGSFPTNWNRSPCTGVTYQVIGTGQVNNLPYIDARINGTNGTASTCFSHIYMQYTLVPVSPGEKWSLSAYTQLLSGTHNPGTMGNLNLGFQEFDNTNVYLTGTTGGSPISTSFTKQSLTATVNNAATTQARMMMNFAITSGTSLDITVRIAAPQLEKGNFVTSFIPTSSGAVTRLADNLTVPVGAWFNNTNGSIAMNADAIYSGANSTQAGIAIHAIGNNGYLFYKQSGSTNIYSFAGAGQSNLGGVSSGIPFSASMGYTTTSARAALNGVLAASFVPSSITAPTALRASQTGNWTGHLQKYKYYPARVGDSHLQLLSQ